jgi:hypothetical protein
VPVRHARQQEACTEVGTTEAMNRVLAIGRLVTRRFTAAEAADATALRRIVDGQLLPRDQNVTKRHLTESSPPV